MEQVLEKAKNNSHKRPSRTHSPTIVGESLHPLHQLQRDAGNQAVRELLRSRVIQPKLTISNPSDPEEREADRVADHIMRAPADPFAKTMCPCMQSGGEPCEECKRKQAIIQRRAAGAATPAAMPKIVRNVLSSPGRPLDAATRAFFESRFGQDFGHVRVHSSADAVESARSLNAFAYTAGENVVFNAAQYSPQSESGKRLLAHELTHVVQQQLGRTPTTPLSLQRTPDDTEPAPLSNRDRQLACVVRLGGCPSSRDGGIPSTEEIESYNRQCSVDTHYSGPDIYPTDEECRNPPKEPLTTGEKIFLGALLIGAAAVAAAAVIVTGAEILPVVIASVGEASTSAIAFYYGNAIVVNEIGVFAAGLLMACEGDVPGLLRAVASDPTQAAALLAEVYILHVNIRVASGPVRKASVLVRLLPPDEQTDPQNIRFRTVGAPQFEESEAPTQTGAPKKPAQLAPGEVKGIGPAFATFEEVDALIRGGNIRADAHVLGVIVKDPNGRIIAQWYEVSERGVGTEQAKLLGHTEQKALARIDGMDLKPGSTLEFVGSLQSCNLREGCSNRMTEFAKRTGIDIRYRYVYGESGTTINDFTAGEGRITKGMRESWTQ